MPVVERAAVQLLAPLRPFAGAPTRDDLVAYFEAVARETSLPITLYLNPGPGADVSIADTIALARLPGVKFIKESSRDLARVSRLIVEIDRAGHARYFTTMQMLLITLILGGSGATMPPPAAEIARHVIDAFLAKDYERAAELQLQFALFPSKWMHRGLAPVMKAAMNLIGVKVGEPYPPYTSLTPDDVVWYTDYARGYLGRFDPKTGAVKEWPSPSGPKSQPYGIATEKDIVWYSESAVTPNTLVRFDPKTEQFQTWAIPSGGGVVRNMMRTKEGDLVLACSGVNRVALVDIK